MPESPPRSLAESFGAVLIGRGAPSPDRARLGPLLEAALADARAAWPGVEVAPEAFARHLAERIAIDTPLEPTLLALRATDLYLACACAAGDPQAVRSFDATFARDVRGALAGLRLGPADVDDLAQVLGARFFVAERGGAPKIADYAGRGSLRSWVRAAATRAGLSHLQARRPDLSLDDGLFDRVPSTGDVELDHLKQRYRADFRRAFEDALAALSPRDRTLLAQSFVDELSVDEIGALHGVHRATAARWVIKAREALLAGTRANLRRTLDVDRFQVDSILRFIASQLDVSLGLLLRRD